MCLLIVKPAKQSIPFEHLENGHFYNSDGTGIAIARNNRIEIYKGADYTHKDIADILDKAHNHPAIIHFRMATHGKNTYENTHPFSVGRGWVAAHNGIIQIPTTGDKSDTREFLDRYIKPAVRKNPFHLFQPTTIEDIATMIGNYNKIAFLHQSGVWNIANQKMGHWFGGVWYSNSSYEERTYSAHSFFREEWDEVNTEPATPKTHHISIEPTDEEMEAIERTLEAMQQEEEEQEEGHNKPPLLN